MRSRESVEAAGLGVRWLYYKVYVHDAAALEHFVVCALPEVLAGNDFDLWFFIRYVDAEGPHLRLRLRTETACADLVSSRVRAILEANLEQARSSVVRRYKPAVAVPVQTPRMPTCARVVMDAYVPETERFGINGMPIAEQLFAVSSDIAVSVLKDEHQGCYSRKTLVPPLMESAAQIFQPEEGRKLFWEAYCDYWLQGGGVEAAQLVRHRFEGRAKELRAEGVHVLVIDSALPPRARPHIERWRMALRAAFTAYAGRPDGEGQAFSSLAFHFVHLMNNRLGIMPLEEAYFAVLLTAS